MSSLQLDRMLAMVDRHAAVSNQARSQQQEPQPR